MSDAITSEPGFSWRTQILSLFRIGQFPRHWPRAAFAVIGSSLGMIALCIWVGIEFYEDPDKWFGEKKPGTLWSVGLLAASGVVCLQMRKCCPPAMRGFWLFSGLLLCLAGLDDLVRIHERMDRLVHAILGWDPNDSVTDHLDDVLVLSYLIPAGWLWFRHRRDVFQMRLTMQLFGLAIVAFVAMVAADMLGGIEWLEESFKIVAGALILCGFLAAYLPQSEVQHESLK
jgi:hypothetical protein